MKRSYYQLTIMNDDRYFDTRIGIERVGACLDSRKSLRIVEDKCKKVQSAGSQSQLVSPLG